MEYCGIWNIVDITETLMASYHLKTHYMTPTGMLLCNAEIKRGISHGVSFFAMYGSIVIDFPL